MLNTTRFRESQVTGNKMKHWTEPSGIFLLRIPIEWQYRNLAVADGREESPYSFEPYDEAIGCFQISCYPLAELAPNLKQGASKTKLNGNWEHSRMDSQDFDVHLFFGAKDDQALIGKYIYSRTLRNDARVAEQLTIVREVLRSIVVVPPNERNLAANLNKHDRFLASLVASYDLLYSAIESESYVEIIVLSANQIDAFLRLSIVLAKQLQAESDDIDVKYLFQGDGEKGLLERVVFNHARELGVIDEATREELSDLYDFRNRIVHRYVISSLKTRDMIPVVTKYLEMSERIRLVLRGFEEQQVGKNFGIYGHGFVRAESFDDMEIRRVHSWANDKHMLARFKRKVEEGKPNTAQLLLGPLSDWF